MGTHSIDQHSSKDSDRNLAWVARVLLAADQLWVFGIEQKAEDAKDDDCEGRYDGAVVC
jgi:hypothetical protein